VKYICGSGGTAPPFLTSALDGDVVSFTPRPFYSQGKSPRYPLDRTPEPVWTLWRTEKSSTAGNQTLAVQPRSPSLYRLLIFIRYRLKQEFLIARFCENRNPAGCLLTRWTSAAVPRQRCWMRIDLYVAAQRSQGSCGGDDFIFLAIKRNRMLKKQLSVSLVVPRISLTGCSGKSSRNVR
jgi:hypothetical protein